MNYFSDSSEWRYLFRNAIDWETIAPLYHKEFPTADGFKDIDELISFYEDLLTTTGDWSANSIASRARELDEQGGGKVVDGHVVVNEVLKKTYKEAREMDLFGVIIDPKYGGLGLPASVGQVIFTQLSRACVSTATQLGFHTGIADMMHRYCNDTLKDKYIPMIQRGEISGCMCMTEPGAGSDVGSMRTSAEKRLDGSYLLNGSKIFITNGGGGLAFVLARVKGAAPGLDGLSMFFAEEWIQTHGSSTPQSNYTIAKVEDKLGMHGSITCEVVFENSVVHLVGKENEGFKIMLHLMNEARLSVGLQGLGIMEACLGQAREYANTRVQFGKPIAELPLMKKNLQEWETERDAFRVLMVDTLSSFEIFQRLHLKKVHTGELTEEETKLNKKASQVCRRRTPLVKYYGAEACVLMSQKAIQVFAGYGYMAEYDVERFHRDSFGALIYEGTSQIQALMAMKDFVKFTMKNPKKFLQSLVAESPISSLLDSDSECQKSVKKVSYEFRKQFATLMMRCFTPETKLSENGFKATLLQLNRVFKKEYWQEADRFDKLMTHAETICQALAYKETLLVLAKHAHRNKGRAPLYHQYLKLVTPRLAAIYSEWGQ
jgi:alkylation response protein AidB-like acyl-CoA dehydrogenase